MITNEIYFFKNQSSVSTSDYLYNVNDGTLILQVDGDVSNLELSVLGNTDLIDDDFVTLKTINASDYNMSDKITSTGIYWIDINGIRKIKLNLSKITGSVNVKAITKRGLTTDLVARAMAANSAGGGSYTLPVASASTLGGIKVGENLTIDEDGTLSASGGTEVLPIYNVECDISNGPSPNWYDSNSNFAVLTKKAINEAYNKGDLHFILNYGSSSNDRGTTLQVVVKIYNTNRPISFNTIPEISYMGGTYKEQSISLNYAQWVYTDGEWTYPTGNVGAQFITDAPFMTGSSARSTFLSKTNTTSYTPTGNYNPATKKYVDDNIKIYNISIQSPDDFLISNTDLKTKLESILKQHATYDTNPGFALLFSYTLTKTGELYYPASVNTGTYNTILFRSIKANAPQDTLPQRRLINPFTVSQLEIEYTNTYTINNIKHNSRTYNLIAWDNQQEITPLGDYNVATKKYVDDAIKTAITTSLEGSY